MATALTGIIPTDSEGDVYYIPYADAPSSAWIKNTTASASADCCKTVVVSLKVELIGSSDTDLDTLLTALDDEEYTVTVAPGTNVKISWENADGAYEATPATADDTWVVGADELLAAKASSYTVTKTLYVAVHGGSSSANSGVASQATDLQIAAAVSGGSISA